MAMTRRSRIRSPRNMTRPLIIAEGLLGLKMMPWSFRGEGTAGGGSVAPAWLVPGPSFPDRTELVPEAACPKDESGLEELIDAVAVPSGVLPKTVFEEPEMMTPGSAEDVGLGTSILARAAWGRARAATARCPFGSVRQDEPFRFDNSHSSSSVSRATNASETGNTRPRPRLAARGSGSTGRKGRFG